MNGGYLFILKNIEMLLGIVFLSGAIALALFTENIDNPNPNKRMRKLFTILISLSLIIHAISYISIENFPLPKNIFLWISHLSITAVGVFGFLYFYSIYLSGRVSNIKEGKK